MEDDPWAQAPSRQAPPTEGRSLRLPVVMLVAVLFIVGAGISVLLPFYWSAPTPAQAPQTPVIVRPPWNPGSGPLVQGVKVQGGMPAAITWSPDGGQLAWQTFDAERGAHTVSLVGVGSGGFSGLQQVSEEPSWMRTPPPSIVRAQVQDDLVALQWSSGPARGQTAGVVDLPGLLGLVDAQSPAVITYGPTTLLAVAARLPETTASPTVHVFDVSELIGAPPK